MALTKGIQRTYGIGVGEFLLKTPVRAGSTIYEGSAVSSSSTGFVRPATAAAGESFRGFAEENKDNASGSDGDLEVLVRKEGTVTLPITLTGESDVGADVYASDDGTFTLSAGTNNVKIGKLIRFISVTHGSVSFEAAERRSVA